MSEEKKEQVSISRRQVLAGGVGGLAAVATYGVGDAEGANEDDAEVKVSGTFEELSLKALKLGEVTLLVGTVKTPEKAELPDGEQFVIRVSRENKLAMSQSKGCFPNRCWHNGCKLCIDTPVGGGRAG